MVKRSNKSKRSRQTGKPATEKSASGADSRQRQKPQKPKKAQKQIEKQSLDKVQRLNRVLAAAGLGSRREVEELIVQGRVEVDREIVTDLACKVNPREVTIKVDGQTLRRPRRVYFAVNKPKGVLSTNWDPSGRMRVVDLVPSSERTFSVGRLDKSSEGLMLLTNDGELAQRLAHPRFRVEKTYFVVVAGELTHEELNKLKKGVHLAEGFAHVDGAKIKKQRRSCTELEIRLSEGKNREIRRILARAGHKVLTLRRTAIGPLRLAKLPTGASRPLTSAEIKALYDIPEATPSRPRQRNRSAARKATASTRGRQGESFAESSMEFGEEEEFFFATQTDGTPLGDVATGFPDDDLLDDFDDDFVGVPAFNAEGSVLEYNDVDTDDDYAAASKPTAPGSSDKSNRRRAHKPSGRSRSVKGRRGKSTSAERRGGDAGRQAGRKSGSKSTVRTRGKNTEARGKMTKRRAKTKVSSKTGVKRSAGRSRAQISRSKKTRK